MLDHLSPPVRGLILDMDGVLWKENTPIGDLPSIFGAMRQESMKLILATNNGTLTPDENLAKLRRLGVELSAGQVITSAEATAHTLAHKFPARGKVFVVGESGVVRALYEEGFQVATNADDESPVIAVVAGIDRMLTYQKVRRAANHIRTGADFYGTNADATFPTPAGLVPGAGAILAAIATAAETQPTVIGKPAPFLFQLAAERMGLSREEILVIGDRLETDIDGGCNWGARTALVLSGVSTIEQARAHEPSPNLVARDLAQLVGA